jgi:Tfp pilus assembly protein PilN
MAMDINVYQIIILAVGLVGVYVKLNVEISRLALRLDIHEKQTVVLQNSIDKLIKDVQEIKILLARKQIDE